MNDVKRESLLDVDASHWCWRQHPEPGEVKHEALIDRLAFDTPELVFKIRRNREVKVTSEGQGAHGRTVEE